MVDIDMEQENERGLDIKSREEIEKQFIEDIDAFINELMPMKQANHPKLDENHTFVDDYSTPVSANRYYRALPIDEFCTGGKKK